MKMKDTNDKIKYASFHIQFLNKYLYSICYLGFDNFIWYIFNDMHNVSWREREVR